MADSLTVLGIYASGVVACIAAAAVWAWCGWRAGLPMYGYRDYFIPKSVFSRLAVGACLALVWPYFLFIGMLKVWYWMKERSK